MQTPPPSEWDELVHTTIREVIVSLGASDAADVRFEFEESAGSWMTSVEPHHPDAASMFVLAEPDNELNLTVGRTWLEVWGVADPVGWLRALTQGVVAGRAEEAAGSRIRIHSSIGILGGGEILFLPWRWHRIRKYGPYRQP